MTEQTIVDLLRPFAKGDGSQLVLLAPGHTSCSYARLLEHIEKTAAGLARAGIGPGDRVAIVLPSGPAMVTAFLAVAGAAACAPLNPAFREQEFEFYLSELRARAVVVAEEDPTPARAVAGRLGIPIINWPVDPATRKARSSSTSQRCRADRPYEAALDRRMWPWCSTRRAPPPAPSRYRSATRISVCRPTTLPVPSVWSRPTAVST